MECGVHFGSCSSFFFHFAGSLTRCRTQKQKLTPLFWPCTIKLASGRRYFYYSSAALDSALILEFEKVLYGYAVIQDSSLSAVSWKKHNAFTMAVMGARNQCSRRKFVSYAASFAKHQPAVYETPKRQSFGAAFISRSQSCWSKPRSGAACPVRTTINLRLRTI
jgi:hypothetical protein